MSDVRWRECRDKPHYFEMFLSEAENDRCPGQSNKQKATPLLGDTLESALTKVGITSERVEQFLGQPCGCEERKRKINQLDAWARRVVSGKLADAQDYLEKIISPRSTENSSRDDD